MADPGSAMNIWRNNKMTIEASEMYGDPRPRCPFVPGLRCGSKFEPLWNDKNGKYTCRDPICASVFRFPVVEGPNTCGRTTRRRKASKPAAKAGGVIMAVAGLDTCP